MPVKLSVNLSEEVVAQIERFANKHVITKTEAVLRAIGTQDFIDKEVSNGSQILILYSNGKLHEVKF